MKDDDEFEVGDDLELPVPVWKTCVVLVGLIIGVAIIGTSIAARDGVKCAIAWSAENLNAEDAARSGCPELTSLTMVQNIIDPEERMMDLILLACDAKSPETVRGIFRSLLDSATTKKNDIEKTLCRRRGTDGDTALHGCARRACPSCCLVLLEFGADPKVKNSLGQTAAEVASSVTMYRAIALYSTAVVAE